MNIHISMNSSTVSVCQGREQACCWMSNGKFGSLCVHRPTPCTRVGWANGQQRARFLIGACKIQAMMNYDNNDQNRSSTSSQSKGVRCLLLSSAARGIQGFGWVKFAVGSMATKKSQCKHAAPKLLAGRAAIQGYSPLP